MRGFTLIEMVVVISITMILSGILLAYNRSSERQIVLYRDQAVVVGTINRAKSLAIQKFRDISLARSNKVACAFGVHFEPPRTFILFQDLGEGGCAGHSYGYNDGNSGEALQVLNLDNRLEFGNSGNFDVFFIPPELTVSTTPAGTSLPLTIEIKTTSGDLRAPVTIGEAGQIVQ